MLLPTTLMPPTLRQNRLRRGRFCGRNWSIAKNCFPVYTIAADRTCKLEVSVPSLCGGNRENAGGMVSDRPEKQSISFSTRVKRWDLSTIQTWLTDATWFCLIFGAIFTYLYYFVL